MKSALKTSIAFDVPCYTLSYQKCVVLRCVGYIESFLFSCNINIVVVFLQSILKPFWKKWIYFHSPIKMYARTHINNRSHTFLCIFLFFFSWADSKLEFPFGRAFMEKWSYIYENGSEMLCLYVHSCRTNNSVQRKEFTICVCLCRSAYSRLNQTSNPLLWQLVFCDSFHARLE